MPFAICCLVRYTDERLVCANSLLIKITSSFLPHNISSSSIALKSFVVVECCELVALALVEFVIEFDPMQTEGVQEALHDIHAHQDAKGEGDPHEVSDPDAEKGSAQ